MVPVVVIPKLPAYVLESIVILDPFITCWSGSESLFVTLTESRFIGTSLYHNGNSILSVNFTLTVAPIATSPTIPVLIISVEIPTPSNLLVKFSSL